MDSYVCYLRLAKHNEIKPLAFLLSLNLNFQKWRSENEGELCLHFETRKKQRVNN
jgi:hypothetical protein